MRRKSTQRARAKRDIIELADYIATYNLDAALRFMAAAEDAIDFLARTPAVGAARPVLHPALTGLRIWPIRGFESYLILYLETDIGVDVLRVLHGARDLSKALEEE